MHHSFDKVRRVFSSPLNRREKSSKIIRRVFSPEEERRRV
jgi:hypothetical protein